MSPHHIDLPKAEPRPGTAVAILVDTSGSMAQPVPDAKGKPRPKSEIAREALNGIVDYTGRLEEGPRRLAPGAGRLQLLQPRQSRAADGRVRRGEGRGRHGKIPAPNGGTAIGLAIEEAYKALYRSGCARKFIVCVTDGENTSGPGPDVVARQLHAQTDGAVQLNFVAFDTKASQFKFLSAVNGHVVEAADGGKLQAELTTIYEKRILAEVPDEPSK